MGTKESLLELERQLWNADEEFYRDTLSEDAVMVFPEPTGILERSAVLEALGGADRWRCIEFDDERLVEVDDTVVQLVYRAVAERSGDGSEYTAFITTTYVQADGSWRLSSHQQTPIDE
ncbi:nuclear transport factor 2 family protein [Salinirubellus salinus]|uniref:Nuclear transport factor 2 family protein n=1 Tax=Salinirubellus salinus TaxID=1364945 RepID=A0A9E7R0V3_9EURY|nr:nuclear transport factor 2 family protein [Salinirubellus salinus]UWM53467.1 nuclear transport factor 2 family protein [Salinirubellus salinus]